MPGKTRSRAVQRAAQRPVQRKEPLRARRPAQRAVRTKSETSRETKTRRAMRTMRDHEPTLTMLWRKDYDENEGMSADNDKSPDESNRREYARAPIELK